MFEMFKKPEEEQVNEEIKTQKPWETTGNSYISKLEALSEEEKTLLAEKSQLLNMEETLKHKIRDEIEVKKHRIENLKSQIPELKQRCEFLARLLEIPIKK